MPKQAPTTEESVTEAAEDLKKYLLASIKANKQVETAQLAQKSAKYNLLKARERLSGVMCDLL